MDYGKGIKINGECGFIKSITGLVESIGTLGYWIRE
jgi:hypothetical protein